jgi:hypothetical protein
VLALIAQHPLQMLLSFLSTRLSSAAIAASPGVDGPVAGVPPTRPARLAVDPVVVELPVVVPCDLAPDEFAVPKALVPGATADLVEFPAPLGSLIELFRPPALAGPVGAPVTAAEPAPAEPAFGVPTGLLTPAEGPLDAPLAEPLPEPAPPALPLWPSATAGESNMATITTLASEPIGNLLLPATRVLRGSFRKVRQASANGRVSPIFSLRSASLPIAA